MSEDFLQRRSSWRLVYLSFLRWGLNQGEEVLNETVLVLRGTSLLREADRVALRWLVRSSGEVGGGSR